MRAANRGVTLVELIVSMLVFGLLLSMVFLLFGVSSRGFRTVENRQGAQNQLSAIRASLQQDLQVTHFYGIFRRQEVTRRIGNVNYPREAFSAVALSDWNSPGSTNDYGLPNWDRWAVYRVTNEDRGQLVRHLVRPANGERGRALLREADRLADLALSTEVMNSTWARVSSPAVLARGVRSLALDKHDRERAVSIEVTIEQKTDWENPKPDVITASFYIKPHNTVPVD